LVVQTDEAEDIQVTHPSECILENLLVRNARVMLPPPPYPQVLKYFKMILIFLFCYLYQRKEWTTTSILFLTKTK